MAGVLRARRCPPPQFLGNRESFLIQLQRPLRFAQATVQAAHPPVAHFHVASIRSVPRLPLPQLLSSRQISLIELQRPLRLAQLKVQLTYPIAGQPEAVDILSVL